MHKGVYFTEKDGGSVQTRPEDLGGGIAATVSALHTFGTDALVLAHFAAPNKSTVACDLGSGCGECLVGLKAEDGAITGARYALSARRAPEPPAGMEAAAWVPGNGEAGFWVVDEPE